MSEGSRNTDVKPSLKLEASATSVAVEIKGSAADRATHALIDLLSPISNAFGLLGDHLSFARKNAAIRAATKASKLFDEEGLTAGDVPPKILLPWLDGASLETEDSTLLTDAWAGLLVRATKSADAVTISYIETLKKLGSREAELLMWIATDTSSESSEMPYNIDFYLSSSESSPLGEKTIEMIEQSLRQEQSLDRLVKIFDDWGIQSMHRVMFFSISKYRMIQTYFFVENEHVISNLEHLGLISVKKSLTMTKFGELKFVWFHITKYAFDMMWACRGKITGSQTKAR